jgi:hypothetical protein
LRHSAGVPLHRERRSQRVIESAARTAFSLPQREQLPHTAAQRLGAFRRNSVDLRGCGSSARPGRRWREPGPCQAESRAEQPAPAVDPAPAPGLPVGERNRKSPAALGCGAGL